MGWCGGVTAESENAESSWLTTRSGPGEHLFAKHTFGGCAEARGGIDIYNALSLYVVL